MQYRVSTTNIKGEPKIDRFLLFFNFFFTDITNAFDKYGGFHVPNCAVITVHMSRCLRVSVRHFDYTTKWWNTFGSLKLKVSDLICAITKTPRNTVSYSKNLPEHQLWHNEESTVASNPQSGRSRCAPRSRSSSPGSFRIFLDREKLNW